MSYRKKHVKNKIYGIKPKKSVFTRLWFWILFLCFIIVLSAFYAFLFYSGFQISNIVISGNETIKTQELDDLVSNYANTGLVNFWNIKIISRSIFLVDLNKLNKEISVKFPVIEKITINKIYPQTIKLDVIERNPIGVYCDSTNRCFLIDQNGIIFEQLSVNPDNLTVVRQTTENGQVFTGEEAIAQNMINAIYKIQKSLKDNFQIDLAEALVDTPIRLNVKTSENWQIYFDLGPNSDINLELAKLKLLLNGEISSASRKNLRYINLIPKDRAIICDNATCGG